MMSAVATAGPAPVASAGTASDQSQSRFAEEAERQSRYRLVSEEGPRFGSFVYKMMDRVTGEVVRQLPREEVVKLADHVGYDSGAVIDTRA